MRGTEKYDFITFLLAMQEEANSLKLTDLTQGFHAYISEIQRLDEKRRVHTLFLTCDAIIRCNDPMQCPSKLQDMR